MANEQPNVVDISNNIIANTIGNLTLRNAFLEAQLAVAQRGLAASAREVPGKMEDPEQPQKPRVAKASAAG